jgi:1-aminocyclopropane-1-carboxylate deaminase/D-cysteine desulfhydrase-like pyridoxal-dependent ACC family enzyme
MLPRMDQVRLGTYPTPVQHVEALSRPGALLWLKRDDLTNPLYGGNKVRKLEHLLAEGRALGASRIVTVGAAGSHHVLATAIFGRQAGFEVEAVLVPQVRTEHVVEHLRAGVGHGLRAFAARSWGTVPVVALPRLGRGVYFVAPGGSNIAGAMGYVAAAREIAVQVRAGELPEPDLCIVTLGSGGTAAGLAAGFALERMRTRVLAVGVAVPRGPLAGLTRHLARACARRAGGARGSSGIPKGALRIDWRYLGAGYSEPTVWGERATGVAASVGVTLDATYTAKTFAAVLDVIASRCARHVLYVHTLSAAPMAPLLAQAPEEEELPPALRGLLIDRRSIAREVRFGNH